MTTRLLVRDGQVLRVDQGHTRLTHLSIQHPEWFLWQLETNVKQKHALGP